MSLILKDNQIYDELWDVVVSGTAVEKGDAAVVGDMFGFYFADGAIGEEVAFVVKARQVLADKLTGTGEDIAKGDFLYYIVASKKVSKTFQGTRGTNSYWCGWAKKSATESDTTVLMCFDGSRKAEAI